MAWTTTFPSIELLRIMFPGKVLKYGNYLKLNGKKWGCLIYIYFFFFFWVSTIKFQKYNFVKHIFKCISTWCLTKFNKEAV